MGCEECSDIRDVTDRPHVVRPCPKCGRELHIVKPGKHGKGIKIQKGDRFVIPGNFISLSLDPRKASGRLFPSGLQFVAEKILVDEVFSQTTDILSEIQKLIDTSDGILRGSSKLSGIDFERDTAVNEIFDRLRADRYSEEWWAFLTALFASATLKACSESDPRDAVWRAVCAERARTMLLFKQHIEDVLWMGQGVSRILAGLAIWDSNKTNSDEQFWQITLKENSYILNQIFAAPVVLVGDNAYVGGTDISRSGANLVDYLLAFESSRNTILVEIKSPTAHLLGKRYRKSFSPSSELTGGIIQVLNYRQRLIDNFDRITEAAKQKLARTSPRCALIIGNAVEELPSEEKRHAFELFRGNQRDVEIITYDELFKKVELLADLFHLRRTPQAPPAPPSGAAPA
jgi:Shedu protein SduA, C-terminal